MAFRPTFAAALFLSVASVISPAAAEKQELHIYSSSKEHLIRPLLKQFSEEHNVDINVTTLDGAAMKTRLEMEGEDTKADMAIVADVANVYALYASNLLAPVNSKIIAENIPETIRAEDNSWVGVAMRARLIFRRVKDTNLYINDYRALANPKWKDGILVRSSTNPYNQSLLADMAFRYGRENALEWAKAIVDNMARDPSGGDRDQLRALASGEGRVAIANSYYYAQMLTSSDESDRHYAEMLTPVFPTADAKYGPHVNIRGAAVLRHSKHKALATQLLEFLTQEEAQKFFTKHNKEYPANPSVSPDPILTKIGEIPTPKVPVAEIGKRNALAITLFGEAGWK